MARVGLANSVYSEGTDSCDCNIIMFFMDERHRSGREVRGAESRRESRWDYLLRLDDLPADP